MAQLTVQEASAAYESAMRNVLPAGPGVCANCKTFIDPTYTLCYPCNHQPQILDALLPITYSEHLGQVHTALRNYKDGYSPGVRRYAMVRLAGVLWRFLASHEACSARDAGVPSWDLVTTVPSSAPELDDRRSNFRTIVGWCEPISARYQRVLRPTGDVPEGRDYDPRRYECSTELGDRTVLLLDDTWARGGHALSAAAALRAHGATRIGLVVIGRHVRPSWQVTESKTSGGFLEELPRQFAWDTCAAH